MNQTLEKAVSLVRSFPEAEQEDLAKEILRLAEERQIDAKLAEAENSIAEHGTIPLEVAFSQVKENLKRKYGL